jgi:hypothetical protein
VDDRRPWATADAREQDGKLQHNGQAVCLPCSEPLWTLDDYQAASRARSHGTSPTATALTAPLWPFNGWYSSSLESRFHTRTVRRGFRRRRSVECSACASTSRCSSCHVSQGWRTGDGHLMVPCAIRRAPSFAPTLNRQQCPPGRALAPENAAGMPSRLRPAATRRVRALEIRQAAGGLITPSLCNSLVPGCCTNSPFRQRRGLGDHRSSRCPSPCPVRLAFASLLLAGSRESIGEMAPSWRSGTDAAAGSGRRVG